jgi:hypothetical protein
MASGMVEIVTAEYWKAATNRQPIVSDVNRAAAPLSLSPLHLRARNKVVTSKKILPEAVKRDQSDHPADNGS